MSEIISDFEVCIISHHEKMHNAVPFDASCSLSNGKAEAVLMLFAACFVDAESEKIVKSLLINRL
jgi:hypothetical protein